MEVMRKMFPLLSEHFHEDQFCIHSKEDSRANSVTLLVDKGNVRFSEALLFQAAVSACHEMKQVTLIRRDQFTSLPPPVHGMPTPEPSVMALLKILYLSDITELVSYLAKLHINGCPDVMVICNLDEYLAGSPKDHKEQTIAKLCAVMVDVSGFMKNKSNGGSLVIASTLEHTAAHIDMYARFCDPMYSLHQCSENSDTFDVITKNSYQTDAIKITAYNKNNHIFMKDLLQSKSP